MGEKRLLTGWGATAATSAEVVSAPSPAPLEPASAPLARLLAGVGERGIIARGLGRSYGDPAQNAGGLVVGDLSGRIALDPDAGTVDVGAGVSLHDLIRTVLPHGFYVPVTPGTRMVSVGGAVASDVHGKNHHRSGSFGDHVEHVVLMTADGQVRTVSPSLDAPLFWATVGGMGLTGLILEVRLRLLPVETGHMVVRTERLGDLDAVMTRMKELDPHVTYSVAWLDTLARGRNMGRSVLTTGEHARLEDLPRGHRDRWALPRPAVLAAPRVPGPGLVSRPAIHAFNELWFRKAPRLREGEVQSASAFFHPLDAVAGWNRLYGRHGFVQYQFVLPDASEHLVAPLLERVAAAGHPSFLSVIKRFGPANAGMLSFPTSGWTVALDVPARPQLVALFATLDRMVLEGGGRLYLAKDARMTPGALASGYPRLDEFRAVRDRVDPERVFQSDLSRRLAL
ncbi:MAG: FAD-binding protein [Nocardioides sp.]|uniref:FAD-binding protein n=1 Tax=Nocardioides sp. TaxID=35761 RepID=UPI003F016900